MSCADDTAIRLPGSAKIEASGRIHLGRRMRLEQHVATPLAARFAFAAELPDDGLIRPFEDPLPTVNPGGLALQELDYEVRDAGAEVFMQDDGLTMSYGIFGAPGSGKTFLMMRLLRQLLALEPDNPERRFGALILDPKAALIEDLRAAAEAADRTEDLLVLNAHELETRDEDVNVIDCDLNPYELARALVLAARSAGVGASEDYWFGAWQNLFAGAIYLLHWRGEKVLTLRELLEAVLVRVSDPLLSNAPPERRIQTLVREARAHLRDLPRAERPEALAAINAVELFYSQDPDNVATVENIISQAYGDFLRTSTRRYSPAVYKGASRTTFYDRIIDEGKLVLVSISPSEPGLAKVLCTLVKTLFMQSMISRLDRVRSGKLRNFIRPVVLACDEYSQIASELPGQAGDGHFFSLARAQGCMGLLATQSVNVLQASSLKENWKSVFSNFSAKIFMRAVDNETVEEATKLAGETDWEETTLGGSSGAQGLGSSTQRSLKERKALPAHVLTHVIERGQAVVIGSLDGGKPDTYLLQVPAR